METTSFFRMAGIFGIWFSVLAVPLFFISAIKEAADYVFVFAVFMTSISFLNDKLNKIQESISALKK